VTKDPDTRKSLEAWAADLDKVLEGYFSKSIDDKRRSLVIAVSATADLLNALGQDDYAAAMAELALAMNDLESGRVDPLLTKTRKKGRAGSASRIWMARAAASIALDLLVEAGLPLEKAAGEIAKNQKWFRHLRETSRTGEQPKLSVAIENWREDLSGNKPTNEFGRAVWRSAGRYRAELRAAPLSSRLQEARRLVGEVLATYHYVPE
jgi:hypothetical protein